MHLKDVQSKQFLNFDAKNLPVLPQLLTKLEKAGLILMEYSIQIQRNFYIK